VNSNWIQKYFKRIQICPIQKVTSCARKIGNKIWIERA
jgi:hypothetical protein